MTASDVEQNVDMSSAPPERERVVGSAAVRRLPVWAWNPFRVGVVVLILINIFWRSWTLSRWSWYQDDWLYIARSQETDLLHYLIQNYNGHIMPGDFLLVWTITRLAPLDYTLAAGFVVICATACTVVWAATLRTIFGERLRLLVPLVILSLSPILLPISIWWAAAIQVFPLQLAMGLAILFHARWLRIGGRGNLIGLTASYVLGLFFWEKALLILIPLVFITLILGEGTWRVRLRLVRAPLAILSAITAVYVPLYLLGTRFPGGVAGFKTEIFQHRSVGQSLSFFGTGLLDIGLPTLAGGPWGGLESLLSVYSPVPATRWLPMLAVLVTSAAVLVAYRRRGWLILAMVACYAALSWGLLLTSSRYDNIGDYAVRDARYAADILPVAILALALCMAQTRMESDRGIVPWKRTISPAVHRHSAAIVGVLIAALSLSTLYGNGASWQRLEPQSPKPWVDSLIHDARQAAPASVFDSFPPNRVIASFFFPQDAHVSRLLLPLKLRLTFNQPARQMLAVSDSGQLKEVDIGDVSHAVKGPIQECGYLVKPLENTYVPITKRMFNWGWGYQLDYYSQYGGTMMVRTDTGTEQVPIPAGIGKMQFYRTDSVSAVGLRMADASGQVCVSKLTIGPISISDRSPFATPTH